MTLLAIARTSVISKLKGIKVYPGAFFVACSIVCGLQAGQTSDARRLTQEQEYPSAFHAERSNGANPWRQTSDVRRPTPNNTCPPFGPTEPVTITKVIDGDTVRLKDGRKVRLVGVNTPEIGRDGKPDQPWSQQARVALSRFFAGQPAELITDRENRDKYGRVLAHLYNQSGKNAEAYLLKQGLAWHVAIPPNLTLADCLATMEQSAREHQLGIWGANGIAPVRASQVTEGGFQRVQGRVGDIQFAKSGWWLVLDDHFKVVIYSKNQHHFDRRQLQQLAGKTVEIRGWVYSVRSKRDRLWRIKLETPYALSLIPDQLPH